MSRDAEHLATLLDTWLEGQPVAPDGAEEAGLLAAARALRQLEDVPPAPAGLNRGRAAFIAAGVQAAEARQNGGLMAGLSLWLGRYRLAPVALAVAALMLGGVVTTARAQASLPGELLYPVKRLTESVQVAMSRGEAAARLMAALEQRRRDEAQALLDQGREATVRFEGLVASLDGTRAMVDGLVVDLGGLGLAGLAPGARVWIEGLTGPDGVVMARSVRVTLAAVVEPTADPARFAATAAPLVMHDEPTPTSAPPASATPLPIVVPATRVATLVPTALPTALPSPTALPPTPDGREHVREVQRSILEGHLERMGPETWIVARVEFRRKGHIVGETPTLCDIVHVDLVERDGKLESEAIWILEQAPEPRHEDHTATIVAMGDREWTIDGVSGRLTVLVTRETVVVGEAAVGRSAHLRIRVDQCGRRIAERIEVVVPERTFSGTLESFSATLWVVNGQPVVVVPGETEVRGLPWVGARVDVRATEATDGTLTAILLIVNGEPPSATPAASDTPMATAAAPEPAPSGTPPPIAPPDRAPGED
jgi:hypothetical protein